jgi:hypothetical protein
MEVGCDLAQGFHFAHPDAALPPQGQAVSLDLLRAAAADFTRPGPGPQWIDAWSERLLAGARHLADGAPLPTSVDGLTGQRAALRCYWLDSDGVQRTDSLVGTQAAPPRFPMLLDGAGTDLSERGFFARAMAHPQVVQVSRPYLQRGFGVACVTLAVTASLAGAPGVLCCDVAWQGERGA